MAIYHLQAKVIQRSKGRSVIAAAAYRAAEALYDAELGRTQNFLAKSGVVHSEILLPREAPARWLDRETLWNEVTAVERRHDAVLAREIELAVPRELSQAEAIALVRDFVREQFVARGMVADLNVHWGQAKDGTPQPHAHVLLTMRRIDPAGGVERRREYEAAGRGQDTERGRRRAPHGARNPSAAAGDGRGSDPDHPQAAAGYQDAAETDDLADRLIGGGPPKAASTGRLARLIAAARLRLGLRRLEATDKAGFGLKERDWNDKALLRVWRERWAEMANARLAELGHDVRIDHRSHAARGIDLEPQNKIGPAGARRAARGEDAERADEHRAIARRNGEKLLANPELALQAVTLQQSTFTRADLARLVNRHSDGAEQFATVMAKIEASPEMVQVGRDGRGRERYSTREMVHIERRLVATAAALNQSYTHRVNDKRRIGVVNGKHKQLDAEQALAYLHVTRSHDLSVAVGIAGGGKSTLLGPARQVWEGEGYRVRGAALSGIAAEGLEGGTGIESRTIASWEAAWARGKDALTSRDVLVVDEAGMIGSRQLNRLIARVHGAGAKLVLVGDVEQLQAIEAGAAFRAVAERVGVIAITEPRRQLVDWQRLATKELASARTAAALDRYQMAGLVKRHATREDARAGVIAAWQAERERNPEQSQLILAHERADVLALNVAARTVLRAAGELGADRVLDTEAGRQTFAEGDRIYFLRNERGLGVKNGTLGTLARIEGGRLTVRIDRRGGSGKEITFDLADYDYIGHGYAATIHKNQGATADQAHVLATPGMDRHLTYVAMSRHRHAARLHWSEEDFSSTGPRDRLGRERAKDTTLDYAESEMDLVAAYAERRGLDPLAPALRPASPKLQAAVEEPTEIAGVLAAAIQAGGPDAESPKPDGYDEAAIRILEEQPPPPQRPSHHLVIDPAPEPPLPVDPAETERQALHERGREAVLRWNEMEQAELATMKAQDWREWRKAWDGLIAYASEIKHDAPLDRLLREHGREVGVAAGSRFELVLQSSEAEIVWALRADLSPDARTSHSPSLGP